MGLLAVDKVDPMQGDAIYQKVKQESGISPWPESSHSTAIQSQNQSDAGDRPGDRPPRAIRKLLRTIRKHDKQSTRFVDALRQLGQELLSSDEESPPVIDRLKLIEDELQFKCVAEDKSAMTMDHLRTNVRTALALQLSQVATNYKEVKEVTGLLRSVINKARSAKCHGTVNSGKRKRALSVNTSERSEEQCPKIRKVDHKPAEEHMYITASGDWIFTSARISPPIGWKFDFKAFMARHRKPKIRKCAKKYFVAGKQLFEFHSWQACRGAGSAAIEATWQSLSEAQRAEWEHLLSNLHDGQKRALSDEGQALLRIHNGRHRAARQPNVSKEVSSQEVLAETIAPRDANKEALAKDRITPSLPIPQYMPTAHEAAQQDGLRRNIPWSAEETRVLLKGIYHKWSIEKDWAELPSVRRRTPKAIECAKHAIKKRHPHGLPVIRADTPFPFTPSRTATGPESSGRPSPASTSVEERLQQQAQSSPAGSRASTHSVQFGRATRSSSASSMVARPTFVLFPIRPPVTPETQDIEYFLLPIDTPECPISDATEEEVSKACSNAFGRSTGFRGAQKLQGSIWVAAFKRPRDRSASKVSRFSILGTMIQYRGHQFPPRYLSAGPPRTFVASITDEPGLAIETLVAAINVAFSGRVVRPKLALQTISRTYTRPVRRILVQFPQSPGLAQFYIPVLVSSSRRLITVRFEPHDLLAPCRLCLETHPGNWCNQATELRYPD